MRSSRQRSHGGWLRTVVTPIMSQTSGSASASDREIWACALDIGAVVITKDEDFAQRKILEQVGPSIVWVRLPNSRKGDLLRRFEAMLPLIDDALARGETLIEVV